MIVLQCAGPGPGLFIVLRKFFLEVLRMVVGEHAPLGPCATLLGWRTCQNPATTLVLGRTSHVLHELRSPCTPRPPPPSFLALNHFLFPHRGTMGGHRGLFLRAVGPQQLAAARKPSKKNMLGACAGGAKDKPGRGAHLPPLPTEALSVSSFIYTLNRYC